jgi:hypothetical protein
MRNREGKEVATGTRALAVERDFYSVKGPNGELFTEVEDALATFDSKGADVHTAMLSGQYPLAEADRIDFGLWIGLQQLRGRLSRRSGEEMYDEMHKLIVKFGLQEKLHPDGEEVSPPPKPPPGAGPGVRIPDLTGLPDDVKEILGDPTRYRVAPPKPQQLVFMLKSVPTIAAPYLAAEWHLLRFDEPRLFTSDEPIILSRKPTPQNELMGICPGSSDAMYLPLSPRHCLVMMRKGKAGIESLHDVDPGEADPINRHSIENFWSQLFRHPDGPPFPRSVLPLPNRLIEVG